VESEEWRYGERQQLGSSAARQRQVNGRKYIYRSLSSLRTPKAEAIRKVNPATSLRAGSKDSFAVWIAATLSASHNDREKPLPLIPLLRRGGRKQRFLTG